MNTFIEKLKHNYRNINFAETLLSVTIFLNILLVFSAAIASSYYGINFIAMLSNVAADGWCDPAIWGVGAHCFGDYSVMTFVENEKNPWITELVIPWNYPAAAMLFSLPFVNLGNVFENKQIGLVFYLAAMTISLLIPAIWATKGKKLFLRLLVIGIASIFTPPAIMALDRGNHVAFVVPALLLVLIGVARDKNLMIIIGITCSTMVKPQFVLLLAIFLILRKWGSLGISILAVGATQIISFVFWPSDFPKTIFDSANSILKYGQAGSLSGDWPVNASIAKSIYDFVTLGNEGLQNSWIASFVQFKHQFIVLILIFLYILLAFLFQKQMSSATIVIGLIAFSSTFASVSWGYYLVFAIPVAAILIRNPSLDKQSKTIFSGIGDQVKFSKGINKISMLFLVLTTSLTLSRIVIPNVLMPSGYPLNSGTITTVFWVISAYLFLIAAFFETKSSPKLEKI